MKRLRRVRNTVPTTAPRLGTPEGQRAAFWRESIMHLSRPALAELLGIKSNQTIERYEKMAKVPVEYRLACAALAARIEFDWTQAKAKVGGSTIIFDGSAPSGGLGG